MKAIIFDFDGVIVDSVNVKTLAFAELYSEYGPEVQRKVKDYHILNGGISRFEKFKYFHKHFLDITISESELIFLADKFSNLVFDKVCCSKNINGALEFIKFASKNYLTFICTGTPQSEIEAILEHKGLTNDFVKVLGSPKVKVAIVNEIMAGYKLHSSEVLFIGDAMTDFKAAVETNIHFIGVRNKDTVFPENTILVDDLNEIKKYL